MNLVDSAGWIEFFFGASNAAFFEPAIKKTSDLIVPVICLYEVFKKTCLVADERMAMELIAQMKLGQIVDIDQKIALSAASLSMARKLPMADSLIYATAREYGAELWTQDDHFKNLPNVHYIDAKPISN